jgi:putative transposase
MSEYRRLYQPGGSYFFTVVTHQRIKILSLPDNITRLKSAFDKVMKRHPFTIEAFVILPDHIHCIWRMPARDSNYSIRWRLIKSYFSGGWRTHMDYIHYNPVKHGYVKNPGDWPHRSFRHPIKDGLYAPDWGGEIPGSISRMDLE